MTVVNCASYSEGRKSGDVALDDISEVLKVHGQFVWIGLHEPDEDLLREVQRQFGLHDLAIEDAHRAHQRHVVPGARQESAQIAADRARTDEQEPLRHGRPPFPQVSEMSCAVAIIEEGTAAGKTPGAAVVAPRSEDVPRLRRTSAGRYTG